MLETVFRLLKVSVIIAICAVFMVAINALVALITSFIFGGVIGEVLAIISCCLPFNALYVFGSIGTATVAILSFLIAKKIFDLTSWSVSAV